MKHLFDENANIVMTYNYMDFGHQNVNIYKNYE